jgi:hypothetical protein
LSSGTLSKLSGSFKLQLLVYLSWQSSEGGWVGGPCRSSDTQIKPVIQNIRKNHYFEINEVIFAFLE